MDAITDFRFSAQVQAKALQYAEGKTHHACSIEALNNEAAGSYTEAALWWRAAYYQAPDNDHRSQYERAEIGALRQAGR